MVKLRDALFSKSTSNFRLVPRLYFNLRSLVPRKKRISSCPRDVREEMDAILYYVKCERRNKFLFAYHLDSNIVYEVGLNMKIV